MASRPTTRRDGTVDTLHGVEVADPYRWLEPGTDEEVLAWTKAQDEHARGWLGAQPGREGLRRALEPLMMAESRGAPVQRGGMQFYSRRRPGEDRARHFVSGPGGAGERLLIDPAEFGPPGAMTVRRVAPSPNGTYVTYALAESSADDASLRIRNVATGEDLPEVLGGARYASPSWLPDESGFYYTGITEDPAVAPPDRPGTASVRFHRLGAEQRFDAVLYGPTGDRQMFLYAEVSADGRDLVLTRQRGFSANDVLVAKAHTDAVDFVSLPVGKSSMTEATPAHGRVFAMTNEDAPRNRVVVFDPLHPARPGKEIVGQAEATLDGLVVAGETLVLHYLDNAHSRVELRDLDGTNPRPLALPGLGTVQAVVASPRQGEAFILYSSFVEPPQWWRLQPSTGQQELFWRQSMPFSTDDMVAEQVWVKSKDGTPVSMFVVHNKDAKRDGERPVLLTGYGGFGVSMTPAFSPTAALWVQAGGVFALPNLRGGGEYGEDWHEAGRRHNKQNVFDDFLASATWLVDAGWTRPGRLAIRGGSNGGLLVGAAMTQRPDLFGAVVCEVPLLDMVRFHLSGSGPTWISEYGSAEDAEEFRTLHAYSPYHRVRAGTAYPPLLMNSADADDRVDPNHARKFVAQMQWATEGQADHPVLLRVESNAGHGGADSVAQRIDATIDVLSFLRATVAR